MNNLFVFCIGGTGLRIMKSIVMLLAAGWRVNGHCVVPILIDPHEDLNERKRLDALIENYKSIRRDMMDGNNSPTGFFETEIKFLEEIIPNSGSKGMSDSRSFGEFCNLGALEKDAPSRHLMETLFSDANFDNSLKVGFKGNPNVGCVALKEFIKKSGVFNQFESAIKDGDRIFIISSIFGGTGASGYPLLEKMIREHESEPKISKALLGAVTVLPYFDLDDPAKTNSSIDSSSFLTKTKSALAYYDGSIKSDFLYYIADKSEEKYKNDEVKQENKAHFIELMAASALFDFSEKSVERPKETQYMARAISKGDAETLTTISMGDGYAELNEHLFNLWMFKLICDILPNEVEFPLRKTRGFDSTFYAADSFKALKTFLSGNDNFPSFEVWMRELAANKRAFSPINLSLTANDRLINLIEGKMFKEKVFWGFQPWFGNIPFDISYFLIEIRNQSAKKGYEQKEKENKMRMYGQIAYAAIGEVYNQSFKNK